MPSHLPKPLRKYLEQYAETETQFLKGFSGQYHYSLVIPFYRESTSALQYFLNFARRQAGILLILVCNRPDSDCDTQWYKTIQSELPKSDWQSDNQQLSLFKINPHSSLLLVDRVINGPPIPVTEGVGLARKIGADLACHLIARGHINSPWIANTDADTTLPDDYFQSQPYGDTNAALIYPYRHIAIDNSPLLATRLYEFGLFYYVDGLRFAGSPYAYQTLGSTLSVHYKHYAMVRGFPRRAGAEDFYLLNKLAKTGLIISLDSPELTIAARRSDRVPFGTGPAVEKIEQMDNPLDYPLYHPAGFIYLKVFLLLLKAMADNPQPYPPLLTRIAKPYLPCIELTWLNQACDVIGLEQATEQCFRQRPDSAARWRHFCDWFDSFKTLKFLHYFRDQVLGNTTFQDWPESCRQWQIPVSAEQLSHHQEIVALNAVR